jgi:aconitate hydratase
VKVMVRPESERLEPLEPFVPWSVEQFREMPVLVKAQGRCTTDAISPAGRWLRYRGHLSNISDNLFAGANNAFSAQPGTGFDVLAAVGGEPLPAIAKHYRASGLVWVAVGDWNYGEGSSREHAAMSLRHLGGGAIIVRGFARIHESNLKRQGVLPLTFADADDYENFRQDDRVSLVDLDRLAPGRPLTARLEHADGTADTLRLDHTLNAEQIEWFWAGSALNVIRQTGG